MYLSKFNKLIIALLTVGVVLLSCDDDNNNTPEVGNGDLTIFETANNSDNFSILSQALQDAGLEETFSENNGPFTVFAPTDDAFNALPDGLLEGLSAEELAQILQFHVINGSVASGDLQASQDVASLLGEELLVESNGGVTVNASANVVTADINASNGVIHAVDEVLLPAGFREPNIIDQARELGNFETFLGALEDTDLTTTVKYKGDFTVFAPSDAAFNNLPDGLLGSLSTEELAEVLQYHLLSGEIFAGDLSPEQTPESLTGEQLFISSENGNVNVNGNANVTTADVDVSNGIIHALDNVLLPDNFGNLINAAQKRFNLRTLTQAVVDAGLADDLSGEGPFTVFAPTDNAFNALPAGTLDNLSTDQLATILQFHVVADGIPSGNLEATQDVPSLLGELLLVESSDGVAVNASANVVTADIDPSNGYIHTIDEVLLPKSIRLALGQPNIIDQAEELGNFETLLGAVEQAGLRTTLKYTGDFTIFAPSDAAFNALPNGLLESLTTDQLAQILLYHGIQGEIFAGDLLAEQAPVTLNGEPLFITAESGNVTVNENSSVTTADVDVTNGVIHAVDNVLLPDAFGTVIDIVGKRFNLTTLVGALSDANLIDDLSGEGPFTVFAPTNAAFDALSSIPSGQDLENTLLFHVIPSAVLSGDLEASQTVETLNGDTVEITVSGDGAVEIDGSAVVQTADLEGTNGVVHIIDGVLTPPNN